MLITARWLRWYHRSLHPMALLRSHSYWVAEWGDFKVLWHAFFQNVDSNSSFHECRQDFVTCSNRMWWKLWCVTSTLRSQKTLPLLLWLLLDSLFQRKPVAILWGYSAAYSEAWWEKLSSPARTRISIPVREGEIIFPPILLVSQLGLCKKRLTREEQTEMY